MTPRERISASRTGAGRALRRVARAVTPLVIWALGGCSGPSAQKDICVRGAALSCNGPGNCAGTRTCEGTQWTECVCNPGPSPTVSPEASAPPALGAACDRDDACPAGAFCLTREDTVLFGGHSAAGVCVADCSGGATACDAFSSAVCVDVSPPLADGGANDGGPRASHSALCFERCTVGSKAATKCHGVPKVACDALKDGTEGFCRPLCARDADCGHGVCDLRTGVCGDTPTARSLPMGTPCDPAAPNNDCQGICTALSPKYAICSHRCVFGDTGECANEAGADRVGGCVFASPHGGLGDTGYCAPLCDCGGDCIASGDVCDGFGNATLETAFGRSGVCVATGLALHAPLTCPVDAGTE